MDENLSLQANKRNTDIHNLTCGCIYTKYANNQNVVHFIVHTILSLTLIVLSCFVTKYIYKSSFVNNKLFLSLVISIAIKICLLPLSYFLATGVYNIFKIDTFLSSVDPFVFIFLIVVLIIQLSIELYFYKKRKLSISTQTK